MSTNRARRSAQAICAAFCLFSLGAAACGQQGATVQANIDAAGEPVRHVQPAPIPTIGPVPEGLENLKLAPGMLLQMDVYGVPEMSVQLRIDAQGEMTIPLVGALRVAGQTVIQAQHAIAKALAQRDILVDPQVTLNLLQYAARHISVTGEVHSPGQIELLMARSVSDVLTLAGGVTAAAGGEIVIQRRNESGAIEVRHISFAHDSDYAILQSTQVEPGDTVIVQRAGVIYVLGAVNRPGGYLMVNNGSLNVVQALSLAGGEALQASTRWATIVRQSNRRIEQIRIPLRKMETGELPAAELQLNDGLYVPTSGWKTAVINGSNVLSAAAAASIYSVASRP